MIIPSILNADLLNLQENIQLLTNEGINRLHIDIMDGHFVPNLSFGPELVSDIKQIFPKTQIEIHLMSDALETLVPLFVRGGADIIEIHYEAATKGKIKDIMQYLHNHNVKVGLVLNPETEPEKILGFQNEVDQILLMTVHPGFGGQTFLSGSSEKIRRVKEILNNNSNRIPIEVDGGVNLKTIRNCHASGASLFVVGSFLFKGSDLTLRLQELKDKLKDS